MLDARRIEQNTKPSKIEYLGGNNYYYNYDIKEYEVETQDLESGELITETRWSFVLVSIWGKPTYAKCVKAIINAYVDTNKELDLINSYNSYQLDVSELDSEYEEYLELVGTIKDTVKKDFDIETTTLVSSKPKQADVMKFMLMTINTMDLSDLQALSVKSLYPKWEEFINTTIKKDTKIQYGGKLFKVIQEHLVQEHMPPSINTASLYMEIVEEHSGTINDPIPYPADGNMIIYKDKYYTEDEVLYKCIRDSVNPLYSKLANLVGNYVELA